MATEYGNPQQPCAGVENARALLDTISREARYNAEEGFADATQVEAGLAELRTDTVQRLGMACGQICGRQERCLLESFSVDDPLLKKAVVSPLEEKELAAKTQYEELKMLAKMGLELYLG